MSKKLPPVPPGEVRREDFLLPLRLLPMTVARARGAAHPH
jgi:hypothetical protein